MDLATSNDILFPLLKQVSRSFYLTLRVLPKSIRAQMAYTYLLARATDTIADTDIIPVEIRTTALTQLRNVFLGTKDIFPLPENAEQWKELLAAQSNSGEKKLLENISLVIHSIKIFSDADHQDIRTVLDIITKGQLLDLKRFVENRQPNEIRSLQTEEELDEYTYLVAGCVGEFWTNICHRHLYPNSKLDMTAFLKMAVHFGKGIQLVNILRDLPADLKNGRCYLPCLSLKKIGLSPDDLTNPDQYKKLSSCYKEHLSQSLHFLQSGIQYISTTPSGWNTWLMRLGCTWPILIGIRTLELLGNTNPLDASQRVKVSRKEVKRILFSTLWRGFIPQGWTHLLNQYMQKASASIAKK